MSTIPNGGLGIPITMVVKRHKASPAVFNKMKELESQSQKISRNRKFKVKWRSDVPMTI